MLLLELYDVLAAALVLRALQRRRARRATLSHPPPARA